MHFEIATADEDERAAVGRPRDLVDLLAVVGAVVRQLAALIGRGLRDPDVAGSLLVKNPGDGAGFGSRSEVAGERRAHDLFECEALGGSGGRKSGGEEKRQRNAGVHSLIVIHWTQIWRQ